MFEPVQQVHQRDIRQVCPAFEIENHTFLIGHGNNLEIIVSGNNKIMI